MKRPARAAPLLALAVAAALVAACGTPANTAGPARGSPASMVPTAAIPGLTQGPTPTPTPEPPVVTVTGLVTQIYSTGGFILRNGNAIYTVAMSSATNVVNLRGREVPVQFIQVANSVQVTGRLSGSTIAATTVLVPVNKDGP